MRAAVTQAGAGPGSRGRGRWGRWPPTRTPLGATGAGPGLCPRPGWDSGALGPRVPRGVRPPGQRWPCRRPEQAGLARGRGGHDPRGACRPDAFLLCGRGRARCVTGEGSRGEARRGPGGGERGAGRRREGGCGGAGAARREGGREGGREAAARARRRGRLGAGFRAPARPPPPTAHPTHHPWRGDCWNLAVRAVALRQTLRAPSGALETGPRPGAAAGPGEQAVEARAAGTQSEAGRWAPRSRRHCHPPARSPGRPMGRARRRCGRRQPEGAAA